LYHDLARRENLAVAEVYRNCRRGVRLEFRIAECSFEGLFHVWGICTEKNNDETRKFLDSTYFVMLRDSGSFDQMILFADDLVDKYPRNGPLRPSLPKAVQDRGDICLTCSGNDENTCTSG
jgi:hypothetical protein